MGDTAEALGHKTDVPGRAREAISDRVESVKSTFTGAKDSVSDSTPSGGDVKHGAKQAVGVAKENPLGLAIGATAVGFVAGLLIPATRVENEKIGPMADQLKETGQEAVERGKHVAQEVASQAADTAKESGKEQAEGLRDSAQEKVGSNTSS